MDIHIGRYVLICFIDNTRCIVVKSVNDFYQYYLVYWKRISIYHQLSYAYLPTSIFITDCTLSDPDGIKTPRRFGINSQSGSKIIIYSFFHLPECQRLFDAWQSKLLVYQPAAPPNFWYLWTYTSSYFALITEWEWRNGKRKEKDV